jgi:hypothetical protein
LSRSIRQQRPRKTWAHIKWLWVECRQVSCCTPRTGSHDNSSNRSFRGISGNLLLLFLTARLRPCRIPTDNGGGGGRLRLMFTNDGELSRQSQSIRKRLCNLATLPTLPRLRMLNPLSAGGAAIKQPRCFLMYSRDDAHSMMVCCISESHSVTLLSLHHRIVPNSHI